MADCADEVQIHLWLAQATRLQRQDGSHLRRATENGREMLPPAVRSGVVPPQLVAVVLVVAGGLAAAAGFGAGQPDGSLPSAPGLQFAGFAAVAAGFVALAAGLVALAAGLVGVAAAVVTGFFVGVAALVPALAEGVGWAESNRLLALMLALAV